jgi:predicted neuraminidase
MLSLVRTRFAWRTFQQCVCVFFALSQTIVSRAQESPVLTSEFIYESAPFPSCHASTIVESADGTLVASWFGGTREKHPDVGIWVSRRVGNAWTTPTEVANGIQYQKTDGTFFRHPTWNPVLFQPKDGPLLLFYKAGPTPQTWWGLLMSSVDNGQTWSTTRRLPDGILGPIKNKPIELPSGEILCPTSTESPTTDVWQVHMETTSDNGFTWRRTGELNDGIEFGAIQPSVLQLGGTELLAVGRSKQKSVFQMRSKDGGRTWGEMQASTLPNPNSGVDAVTLKDSTHLLVYNHVSGKQDSWGDRSPLNLAVSNDGVTWKAAMQLENTPKSEFSYPAIIQTRDGLVHITYTWNRKKIKHIVVDPAKIKPKEMLHGNWPE